MCLSHTRRHLISLAALILVAAFPPAETIAQTVIPAGGYVMIPMRDGVHLRSRIALPTGEGPWPVALTRTPYDDGDLSWTLLPDLPSLGYVSVAQHVRGKFGSEGDSSGTFHNDAWGTLEDAYDTCAWIMQQPWCDGHIGTYGGSGRCALVNMAAGSAPPGLTVEWMIVGASDFFSGVVYHGGAPRKSLLTDWYKYLGTNLMDTAFAHPVYDAYWAEVDMRMRQSVRDHPVVVNTGWYDVFQQSALDNFATLLRDGGPTAKRSSKLVVTPRAHGDNNGPLQMPANAADSDPRYGSKFLFGQYLNGEDHDFELLPAVNYYLIGDLENPNGIGNTWEYADSWPVPRHDVAFYLHDDNSMSIEKPTEAAASRTFTYDPNDPVPTMGGAQLTPPAGNLDQTPIESRPDVIVFETPPLPEPITITGRIWVDLWVSTNVIDTDFTAKLTDVYPDGQSLLYNDGIRRLRYRESYEQTELAKPGGVYRVSIDLWSMALVFNRGHKIRLAISSSNAPRFLPNPNTGAPPVLNETLKTPAQNTIYFDLRRPSQLILPVVGPDRDGDGLFDYFDPDPDSPAKAGEMPPEPERIHSADVNANNRIDLPEILRLVQFFNFGAYHCEPGTEDGYAPGAGDTACMAHDADFDPIDYKVGMSELLQAIQLFNSAGYAYTPEFTPHFVPSDLKIAFASPT